MAQIDYDSLAEAVLRRQEAQQANQPAVAPAPVAQAQRPAAAALANPPAQPAARRVRNVAPAQPQPAPVVNPPAPVVPPAAPANRPAANQPQARVQQGQAQQQVAQNAPPPPPPPLANPPAPQQRRGGFPWIRVLVIGLLLQLICCLSFAGLYMLANNWDKVPFIGQLGQQVPVAGGLVPAPAEVNQVPEVSGSAFPVLFDAQSTGRSVGFTYNIGVNEGQHGLVFGYQITWNGKTLGGPNKGCAFVELKPGWYPDFYILDGRYEVRTLPAVNGDFWKQKLTMDGLAEQGAHYGCPVGMSYDQVVKWSSALPSPPVTGQVAPAPAAPVVKPTAAAPAIVPAKERRATGGNQTLSFVKGDSVYGWEIVLSNGQKCTGGECYLQSAPSGGTVTSGVVNPWDNEVPATTKAKVWKP